MPSNIATLNPVRSPDLSMRDYVPGMLGSLRVNLTSIQDIDINGIGGEALNGMLMAVLSRGDLPWADKLHRMVGPKPMSISPLYGCKRRNGRSLLNAGQTGHFFVSLLETDLLSAVISSLQHIHLDGERLRLGNASIEIDDVDIVEYRNQRFASFAGLLERAPCDRQIALEFLSPTTFKLHRSNLPLPQPELVFSSLLQRWEAASHIELPPGVADYLSSVMISRYQAKTELVAFNSSKAIGFTGAVLYEIPDDWPQPMVRALNCLADFAFYSGVGWKTTMGMGQTRRVNKSESF